MDPTSEWMDLTMETKDIGEPSKWVPMKDPRLLAAIGKLGEEVNELGAIIFRCIIQGINEKDPETGKHNLVALAEEIADVRALSAIVIKETHLDWVTILERAERKSKMKNKWLDQLGPKP